MGQLIIKAKGLAPVEGYRRIELRISVSVLGAFTACTIRHPMSATAEATHSVAIPIASCVSADL